MSSSSEASHGSKISKNPGGTKGAPAPKAGTPAKPAAPAKRTAARSKKIVVETDGHHDYDGKRTGFLRTFGSFLFSSVLHAMVLVVLGLVGFTAGVIELPSDLAFIAETHQDELTKELDESTLAGLNVVSGNVNGGGGGGGGTGGTGGGLGQGHGDALGGIGGGGGGIGSFDSGVAERAAGGGGGPAVGSALGMGGIPGPKLNARLPPGMPGDPQAPVSNLGEAMDRLTREFVAMMEERKILVVWLFDESESMKEEQKTIRDKIERVYQELGLLRTSYGDALTSAVASYGDRSHIHTKIPTHDVAKIRSDMDAVPIEPNGKENMCAAVLATLGYYKSYVQKTQRQMAMVILTDETGEKDDGMKDLENCIAMAEDLRCKVYVLGREAVFGYPYAYMSWRDPKNSIGYWLQIDRGPETPFVEQLQTEGFWRRWDAHGSGFGPYEQSRLARETGGIFFVLPSPETNLVRTGDFKYELERMRPYMPSLESRADYLDRRSKSPLQQLLWKVISDLNPWDPELGKTINLRQAYSLEPAAFAREAAPEMVKAEKYVRYLHAAEEALEGALPLRKRESYHRWQANFDLIRAQVIAYKIRVYQYGAYLHWYNTNPADRPKPALRPPGGKPNPNLTTHWDITTRAAILPTDNYRRDKMEADIKLATDLFNKVIKDYEGTPWANRAKYELARGFGVHVVQDWDDVRRGQGGVKVPKL